MTIANSGSMSGRDAMAVDAYVRPMPKSKADASRCRDHSKSKREVEAYAETV